MDICRREFSLGVLAGVASRACVQQPRPKLLILVILERLRSGARLFWTDVRGQFTTADEARGEA
jgi:hypothetical protein